MGKIKKTKIFLKGFTLIELIIIIAITSVLFLVGYFSLNSPKSENKVKAAQREVVATMKAAHSYALQGKTDGASVPRYWGLKFTDNKTYQIFLSNNVNAPINSAPDVQQEEYRLNNGVEFDGFTSSDNTRILFLVPHGKASLPGGAASFSFNLELDGVTKAITISSDGVVEEGW